MPTVTKMKEQDPKFQIDVPNGIEAKLENNILKIKGPKGEVERKLMLQGITITLEDKKIILSSQKSTKRHKTIIGTYTSHIQNMIKGVTEEFIYKLKICSGHFPMTVSIEGKKVAIKNFMGEKIPRKANILGDSKVTIEGDIIIVENCDKESASQTAANIEQACRITNRDRRIFQDGCYIISKAGKGIK